MALPSSRLKILALKLLKGLKGFFSRVHFFQFLPLPGRTSLIWAPTQMNACSKASYGADHYKYDWGGGGFSACTNYFRPSACAADIFPCFNSFFAQFFSFVPLCANCFVLPPPPSLFLLFRVSV